MEIKKMSEEKSVNQKCLENILCHLTKMVVLTEHDEIDYLKQLVKMSTSVSAQLLGVTRQEENNDTENNYKILNDGDICEVNMTSEHIDDYIRARQGKLSKDEISLLLKNDQIDHLQFNHDKDKWQMWDTSGKCFEFCEKD
jgi:phosphotransacetylase